MGNKVKPSPMPYEYIALHAFVVGQLAPGNMPKDGHLRGRVLKALVQRFKTFYERDCNHVLSSIASIAKVEAFHDDIAGCSLTPEERETLIQEMLDRIASEPASHPKHNKDGIEHQQDFLHDLMTREQYLAQQDLRHRLDWIRARWEQLVGGISLVGCLCTPYRTDFDTFAKAVRGKEREDYLIGVRDATDTLLAYLHSPKTVSPRNFRKTLKNKR